MSLESKFRRREGLRGSRHGHCGRRRAMDLSLLVHVLRFGQTEIIRKGMLLRNKKTASPYPFGLGENPKRSSPVPALHKKSPQVTDPRESRRLDS